MIRARTCLLLALIGLFANAAAPTLKAAPEHDRLVAMCGVWDVEMTLWLRPGGAAVSTKGTSTIRSLLDGLFIEEKIEGALNGTPFTTLAWTGFNTSTHQYEATRIATTNTARISETGAYDEKTQQFELKADYVLAGDTWHQRTVIQPAVGRRDDRRELPEFRQRAGVEGGRDQIRATREVDEATEPLLSCLRGGEQAQYRRSCFPVGSGHRVQCAARSKRSKSKVKISTAKRSAA